MFLSAHQIINWGLALFSPVLVCIQGIIGGLRYDDTMASHCHTSFNRGTLFFGLLSARILSIGENLKIRSKKSGFRGFQEKPGMIHVFY
ncbi:MAG: hypothetical protein CM1200mP30_11540 [Pseudomonadota bacterium]|nr:MAG: hypothetical protein CM1200mP30_11540 [Pseudomonadota bacterium]